MTKGILASALLYQIAVGGGGSTSGVTSGTTDVIAKYTSATTIGNSTLAYEAAAVLQLGADAATATAQEIKGPDSTGTDVAGANLSISAGDGTDGNAGAGSLILSAGALTGSGAAGYVEIVPSTGVGVRLDTSAAWPLATTRTYELGTSSKQYKTLYIGGSIQGSDPTALGEGVASGIFSISVPQTAGSNAMDAVVDWAVYATDGTDTQIRRGSTYVAAVNKAGTETCNVGDIGTTVVAVSAGTLTCTTSCLTGLTDVVQFALSCTSSLSQTTLTAYGVVREMLPNAVQGL